MKQSSNLGLALYEQTDLMNITGSTNSLNHNMELIDLEISQLKQEKADQADVNQLVQKVENALPNALQAEEKVNAFMTASDARIEDMESRVNSAISDIEVLTKGFNYLEVEW